MLPRFMLSAPDAETLHSIHTGNQMKHNRFCWVRRISMNHYAGDVIIRPIINKLLLYNHLKTTLIL
jgi:hypothetical protein